MNKHKFSAADLVKRSASQILYFKMRNERFQPTERMKRGQEYQEKVRVDNYPEMRGIWELDNALIYFTWDEIIPIWNSVEFIEIKMTEGKIEDWYFNSSVLQTAFYGALSQQCNDYYTAKFARKKMQTKHLNVQGKTQHYILRFGPADYSISMEPDGILAHFREKIEWILSAYEEKDFDIARDWDKRFKFKDFEILRDKIHFEPYYETVDYLL